MKKRKHLLILGLVFLLTVGVGFGSWVIMSKTIFAPSYNPNSNSVLFNAYNGQDAVTYNGQEQGPTSKDTKIADSNVIFKYRKAGEKTFYTTGKPKNAGTYDILLEDKTGTYINDVVRFTIKKATTATLNTDITILPIYEGDTIIISNLKDLVVTGVNNETLKGDFVLKTQTIEFVTNSSDSKNVEIEYNFILTDSFQINNYDIENEIFKTTVTIKAIAYISGSSKTYFGNLNLALDTANNNTVFVIPNLKNSDGSNHEINVLNNLIVKSGVTLCIPYENETYTSSGSFSSLGNSVINTNDNNVKNYRKTVINFRNSATLQINSGGIVQLGGIYNRVGCTNLYTEFNLGLNSSITCSGTFYCFGYVKENYLDARNSGQDLYLDIIDNSFDAGRFLKIENGGQLITPLAIKDSASGGVLTALADAKVCAVCEFDMPQIQTYSIFEYGSKVDCKVRMTAASNDLEKQIGFIRPSSSNESAILYIVSGNISLEYIPMNPKFTQTNINQDKTKIIINGQSKMGYLKLDVQIASINTSDYFFPFSYKYELFVNKDAALTLDYKVKFLPGSKLTVLENGSLNLNSELIIYKTSDMENLTSNEGVNYPKKLSDAILINNGIMIIGNNGKIGAFIQHTNTNNTGKVDLSNINQDSLTVTSVEGTNNKEIIISSTALFNDNDTIIAKLISTNKSLSSVYSNGNYFWNGESYDTYDLNVIIEDNNYDIVIFDYTLKMADDANGTNETQLSATNDNKANSFKIIKGKYINIVVNRAKSAKIAIESNESNCDNNTWYLIDNDTNIIISPNEGISVAITTTGNSGAGHVEYTIYESNDNGSTWTEIAKTDIGKVTGYVIKNYKFKFTTYSSYGYYFTTKPVYKDDVLIGVHGKENVKLTAGTTISDTDAGNNLIYQATGNYEFKFNWNFQVCILPDTLITMADGTYKKAEDIKAGDIVMSFNHETGKFEPNQIIINDHAELPASTHYILNIQFSNNILTRICGEQGFFDLTLNKYVYIRPDNYKNYIGHKFYSVQSSTDLSKKIVTLLDCYETIEYTKIYSPVSNRHFNIIADNMLEMPGAIDGLFNIFEYNPETLQFDQTKMQDDINKYGLLSYEDFKELIPYEVYSMIPGEYLNISIQKGYITWDIFKAYVEKWSDKLMEQIE